MTDDPKQDRTTKSKPLPAPKKRYNTPMLTNLGSVKRMTAIVTGTGSGDGASKKNSDPAMKQNIVKIGDHPWGFGLYTFEYKHEFQNTCGLGVQFGVMADEVAARFPAAVSRDKAGFLVVDYAMIGLAD